MRVVPLRSTPILLRPPGRESNLLQRAADLSLEDLMKAVDAGEVPMTPPGSPAATTPPMGVRRRAATEGNLEPPARPKNAAILDQHTTHIDVDAEHSSEDSGELSPDEGHAPVSKAAREFFDMYAAEPAGSQYDRLAISPRRNRRGQDVHPSVSSPLSRSFTQGTKNAAKAAAPTGSSAWSSRNLAEAEQLLPRVLAELRRSVEKGLCQGAQFSVRRTDGEQLDLVVGHVRDGVPMRRDIVCHWMSTVKPITVVAIAQMYERGLLAVTDRVAKHLPEFGCNGKEDITIEHLLTHTAGIPYADTSMWSSMHQWTKVIQVICASQIEENWTPGKRCGYHAYSAWFLLGEIVRRLDGRPYHVYVREAIFAPLQMHDCFVGMDSEHYKAYAAAGRIAELYTHSSTGKRIGKTSVAHEEVTACVPGANGRGPACQLLRFFDMLLHDGKGRDGVQLLRPETVRKFTRASRVGMYDEVQGVYCDWALGFFVGAAMCGPHAAPDVFGHGGSQSSMSFVDRARGVAVSVICNGRPGAKAHYERMARISTAMYDDFAMERSVPIVRRSAENSAPAHQEAPG
jgi:CubicO group peptidase (beta-lactamase class C family)